jgi:glucose/arabinose dehydrogenase
MVVIYGQIVVGPPACGKTAYCYGMQMFMREIGRNCEIVNLDFANDNLSYTPFIEGWLDVAADLAWGRPVDIELMPDGSMLISDDFANVIYRVVYQG